MDPDTTGLASVLFKGSKLMLGTTSELRRRLKQQLIVMNKPRGCLAVWLTDRVPSMETFQFDQYSTVIQ